MVQLLYIPLYALYAGLFIRLIFKWRFFEMEGVNKRHLVFFFLLKVIAGLGLTLIYTYYYTDQSKADIYRYFADSKIISSVLFKNPIAWLKIMTGVGTFEPGTFKYLANTWHFSHPPGDFITSNAFLIRLVSLLNYLSGYNIYIDTLLVNCITFISLTLMFKALRPYFSAFPQILYWPLFLMPSLVFWSSGLLKEGLMMTGISLYLNAALVTSGNAWRRGVLMLVGLVIVLQTKIYVLAVLLLCSIFLPFKELFRSRVLLTGRLVFCLIVVVSIGYGLNKGFCEKVIDKHNEFIALAISEHSGTAIDTQFVEPGCGNLISLFPKAMVNTIMTPFIWQKGNLFEMLFGAENLLFIIALLFLLVFYFKKPSGDKLWLVLFCMLFAALNYLGIGITVPIVGAIVHYRVVAAPFLLLTVLLMTDLEKLKQRLSGLFSF